MKDWYGSWRSVGAPSRQLVLDWGCRSPKVGPVFEKQPPCSLSQPPLSKSNAMCAAGKPSIGQQPIEGNKDCPSTEVTCSDMIQMEKAQELSSKSPTLRIY